MQELNRSIILDTIRKEEPLSRSDIAKRLSISPTTVATAVKELIKNGFVIEGGEGHSSGGRKPILLRFNPNGKHIIAVSITNSDLSVGIMNLAAETLYKKHYEAPRFFGQRVIEVVKDAIKETLDQPGTPKEDCLGIAIIAPGIVDANSGEILYNAQLDLHNVNIVSIVREEFQIETWLDNDVNALMLAEKEFGDYKTFRNIVYVKLTDGVGAGAYLNNRIFRGHNGGAGEFGHISVDKSGMRCECGNNGCLESYISWSAIAGRIELALQRGRKSILRDLMNTEDKLSPVLFKKGVEERDPLCIEVAEDVGSYLTSGLVNIIHLYNPEVVILGGEVIDHNAFLLKYTKEQLYKKTMRVLSQDLKVVPSSLGEDYELIGCVAVLFQDFFRIGEFSR
ncbi:ROK family transcriptional regulator [Alteribacter keqinensis]|uniref:ROK family transcriptional regulator n=2 Tax=Alteribacter keqinensis TaxID=2483800 RepID=A0A3M7TQ44_9BACI|nr:ROK family transcriptional regulator [Alteribacter keqinensis]